MQKTKFIFLVLPHVHLMDLAGPDQAILEAIDYGANFEICYCGIHEQPVSSAGLKIEKPIHFLKMKICKGDFIVIPGSSVDYYLSEAFKQQADLLLWLREAYSQHGASLMSICAGAFLLAQTGVLDGLECTTHFKRTKQLQALYPKLKVKENVLFVEQNNIYTSAGIASGIDLTLHIIEKLTDSYFAHKVARELVIYIRRDGNSKQESVYLQYRNHVHAGIHKTQDYVIENLNQPFSLFDLADMANMSYRNYSRIFKKEVGITVLEYIQLVRKEKAHSLLKNPDLSRKQIANSLGLKSEKQLIRILQKK